MMAALALFAAEGEAGLFNATTGIGKGSGLVISDLLLILAVDLVLALGLVIWAKYLRGSGRSHHHHHRRHHHQSSAAAPADTTETEPEPEPETAAAAEDEAQPHRHQRRKIHRREHRPRNPTLAETGGLPPVRDDKSPPLVP